MLSRLQRSPLVADAIPRHLRAIDIALVLLVLPFALLVGAVVAAAVLIDSPGPVIYRSRRIGRGGRPFDVLKFRTMRHEAGGPSLSAKDDVRYTPLGRSLSASRLDELPQILNVLNGDMRFVGPRPELQSFVEAFPDEYEKILSVPPGLAGPAQLVYATEGWLLAGVEDRVAYYIDELLPRKVAIDLDYAERQSLLRDLRVLFLTALLPIKQSRAALRDLLHHEVGAHDPAAGRPAEWRRIKRILPVVAIILAVLVLAGLLLAESSTSV